jgi:hypothetical protein
MTAKPSERVRVELASAERLLAGLPDRSIDLLITDPPYTSINRSPTSGSHLRDWFADGLTWPQIGRVFALGRLKLKADGVLMAMTNNDGLREAIGALERSGFIGIRTITWDRQWPGLGGGLRHQVEFVLLGRLPGSRTLSGVDLVSVAAVGPGTAGRYPTMKPDGLGRELAAMAGIGRGSLVVDPFCGSGALLVGAVERGATVVGGDVAKRAVELASARLRQASSHQGRATSRPTSGQPRSKPAPAPATRRPAPAQKRARSRPASAKPAIKPRTKPAPAPAARRPAPAQKRTTSRLASAKPRPKPAPAPAARRPAPAQKRATSRLASAKPRPKPAPAPAARRPAPAQKRATSRLASAKPRPAPAPAARRPAPTQKRATSRPASGQPRPKPAPAPATRRRGKTR